MNGGNTTAALRRLARRMAAETIGDWTDRQLVEHFLAERNGTVFEVLVRRHGPMVYRVCWRVLQQAEDAEDAFQATFLVLARNLAAVRDRDSLASWLHGVAHRIALKARTLGATRRRHEARAAVPSAVPPDDLTWKELRAVLDAELARLPEKWRLPLVLCYLEGRTQDEAAAELGYSGNTLRRRLEDARAALGRCLSRRGFWKVIETRVDGEIYPTPEGVDGRLVIEGDEFRLGFFSKTTSGGSSGSLLLATFKLNTTTSPRNIDLEMSKDPEAHEVCLGIYKLDGDDLMICLPYLKPCERRPTEFKAEKGSDQQLYKLRRARPEKK